MERNMETRQEYWVNFHQEQEENFNRIEELLIELLRKEVTAGNDEDLKFLYQHKCESGIFHIDIPSQFLKDVPRMVEIPILLEMTRNIGLSKPSDTDIVKNDREQKHYKTR